MSDTRETRADRIKREIVRRIEANRADIDDPRATIQVTVDTRNRVLVSTSKALTADEK